MTTFNVYCFNDSYQLWSILNGVVHFMGSSSWSTLSALMLSILLVLAVLKFQRVDPLTYLRNMFLPFFLYLIFFATPTKLNFNDEFSGEVYTLSNVPIGVAVSLWGSSLIEKAFIDVIDNYVTPPQSPKFKEVDYFGHARLMSEVATTNLWINPSLQQTLTEYFKNCVLHMISNNQLQAQKIKTSSNLLETFASTNQALFTQVFTETGSTVDTCANAYQNITTNASRDAAATTGVNKPFNRAALIFGSRAKNGALATASFDTILSAMFNGQQDNTEALFLQNLFINSTRSGIAQIAPDLQAAMAEAETKHFTSGVIAATIYIKQLPKLRSIFKLVMVALFPIIGAFFLASSGRPFLCWAGYLLWVSLWLPAEAAVHAVYVAESINDLKAVTSGSGGYTLASNAPIIQWATETAALAGSVMLIVPVMTGMLIRWAFPYVGTTIAGMLQGARGLERQVSSASVGAMTGARERVLGLEKDKLANAMMDFGDRNTAMRKAVKDSVGTYTDNMYEGTFGQRPSAYDTGKALALGAGDYTMSLTANTQELSTAQASLSSAVREHEGLSRGLMATASLQDLQTGGKQHQTAAQAVVSEAFKQDSARLTSTTVQSLENQGFSQKYGQQFVEDAARYATVATGAEVGVGGSLSKSVAENKAKQILEGAGRRADAGGTLKGSVQYGETSTTRDSVSRGDESALSKSSGISRGDGLSHTELNSKSFNESASHVITNSLNKTNSQGMSYSDALQKTYSSQQSFEAQKSRVDSLSSAIANTSGLKVDVKSVFGTLSDHGVGVLSNYNSSANKVLNSTGNSFSAAREGYIDFTKNYEKAKATGDRDAWREVFRTIGGLEQAHASSGNSSGVSGAQSMRDIALGQYSTFIQSHADLKSQDFDILGNRPVGYTGSGGKWASDPLLGRSSGNAGVDAVHATLTDKAPQAQLPTNSETAVPPSAAMRLQYPKPPEMSQENYEKGLQAADKAPSDRSREENYHYHAVRETAAIRSKTRTQMVRGGEPTMPSIDASQGAQAEKVIPVREQMGARQLDAKIKNDDDIENVERKAGLGRAKGVLRDLAKPSSETKK